MKKYPCKECDLKFATESKLERHVNECHLQIKEFECKDCEKSFARKDKLAEHVEAVHQKKQKYLCSKCGKGFYHKFNMTRHVITCKKRGKNKEPRECPECDRVFSFQSELKRHVEVVHLKVKRHKCEHCSKGFSQKCMLEDHVNAVHLKKREHQSFVCKWIAPSMECHNQACCHTRSLQNFYKTIIPLSIPTIHVWLTRLFKASNQPSPGMWTTSRFHVKTSQQWMNSFN